MFDDFGWWQWVVESHVTSSLWERSTAKFGNDKNFETYLGLVLFTIALDTCNSSVYHDMIYAQSKYNNMTLDKYPGENIVELATEALQLIRILSGPYSLRVNLGTKLIKKVTSTSSKFFNWKMYALFDIVRTLRKKLRLKDPITMGNYPDNIQYGSCIIYLVP